MALKYRRCDCQAFKKKQRARLSLALAVEQAQVQGGDVIGPVAPCWDRNSPTRTAKKAKPRPTVEMNKNNPKG